TGGCRSCYSHSQAAAADTVCLCDYSGAAATRSDLGSNPERSSFSGALSGQTAMNSVPSQGSSEVKFEIGHVLFIDIVGYSKLLSNEQSEQIQKLKQIVRGTEQCRLAEAEGKLLRLPTGYGGALVCRTSL